MADAEASMTCHSPNASLNRPQPTVAAPLPAYVGLRTPGNPVDLGRRAAFLGVLRVCWCYGAGRSHLTYGRLSVDMSAAHKWLP